MLPSVTTRISASYNLSDLGNVKLKAQHWAAQFDVLAYFDSNEKTTDYPALLAVSIKDEIISSAAGSFEQLKKFYEQHRDWCFGYLAYDLKNDTEDLYSQNQDHLEFPDLHFFCPEIVIEWSKDQMLIHSTVEHPDTIFAAIQSTDVPALAELEVFADATTAPRMRADIRARITPGEYLQKIKQIQEHILAGDIYELNFCQEFFLEKVRLSPFSAFRKLNALTRAPFACYYKSRDHHLLCASPERFLRKLGDQLISQPIKGTIHRGANPEEDDELRIKLLNSKKDRSENVMIVDLVRNDLGRSCVAGTVQVDELFGIYTFEQVHQMISTVRGQLRKDVHFIDAIKNCFPMGSMTGAPKVKAMQLIEKYETTKRGLYSGAVGYIRPDGDFDFNVVIRSILYHAKKEYLSFQVGGAIIYGSQAAQEYEECLLKAKAIFELLTERRSK